MDQGIVDVVSAHSVDQTVERLRDILAAKGLTVFALVDHGGEAKKVGLEMPATKLVIFGSAKAGTPLMQAAPSTAIDLPLKILVRDDSGRTLVSFNSPEYLRARHGFPADLMANIAGEAALAGAAAASSG